jgi:DNA replication protein
MNPVIQFNPAQERLIRIPESFFTQLLATSKDEEVIRLTLFAFWLLELQERTPKFFTRQDFLTQECIQQAFQQKSTPNAKKGILNALEKTVQAGIFLQVNLTGAKEDEAIYFINTPKGRAAAAALANGDWNIEYKHQQPVRAQMNKPNIFKLYEDHVGAITPIMAEFLMEAENDFPAAWITEAFELAVAKNARNWRYIEAILKRWQENGKDGESQQNTEKSWQKYLEGENGDAGEF